MIIPQQRQPFGLSSPFSGSGEKNSEVKATAPLVTVVLPTFNEAENIPHVLQALEQALTGLSYEVIVVDDNSPDGTWKVAQEHAAAQPGRVRSLRRLHNRGLSSAVLDGFAASLGDILVVMDADLQHDEKIIPQLVEIIKSNQADVAVGSRRAAGGSQQDWSKRRRLVSWVATVLAKVFLSVDVSDPMSGFFALKRSSFEALAPSLDPKGFKILLEFLARDRELRVAEVGYAFRNRQHGESKLSTQVIVQYLAALYSLSLGSFIPLQFIKYATVGLSGVGVNQLATWVAKAQMGQPAEVALIWGIELSLLWNFWFNNIWTFHDQRMRGARELIFGLFKFHVVCLAGALINYSVCLYLVNSFHWNLYVANGVAIVIATAWNYLINRQVTWMQ